MRTGGGFDGRVVSATPGLAEGDAISNEDLHDHETISPRGTVWAYQPAAESCCVRAKQHCGRTSPILGERIPPLLESRAGIPCRDRDPSDDFREPRVYQPR